MSIILKMFFLIFYKILYIYCEVKCNKETNLSPSSKYHCSGLSIDGNTNKGDKYCCLWTFIENSKKINRCSSISENQFLNLTEYIKRKSKNYTNINIECTQDQYLYCSNVVLDEEDIDDCSKLPIYIEDDMFCCRWQYKDSTNNHKNNNYCASINEFEYLNINYYIRYKNDHPDQRYDDLTIDCKSQILKVFFAIYLLIILL